MFCIVKILGAIEERPATKLSRYERIWVVLAVLLKMCLHFSSIIYTVKLQALDYVFRLVAHLRIFTLFMRGKFDAYLLWPLAKRVQNWIADWSIASNFTVFCLQLQFVLSGADSNMKSSKASGRSHQNLSHEKCFSEAVCCPRLYITYNGQ